MLLSARQFVQLPDFFRTFRNGLALRRSDE
jgi:hypothetical protein